jgi:hypothetical protein
MPKHVLKIRECYPAAYNQVRCTAQKGSEFQLKPSAPEPKQFSTVSVGILNINANPCSKKSCLSETRCRRIT